MLRSLLLKQQDQIGPVDGFDSSHFLQVSDSIVYIYIYLAEFTDGLTSYVLYVLCSEEL